MIVVLGGDGTARAAAAPSGDVPLLPLSTGTNNAFPEMWEATVAGTAAGLLATGRVSAGEVTHRCKALHVRAGEAHEIALVDVCVTTVAHVAAKALWQPATLRELYCTFAEPHAIGLSSIAGLLHPVARTDSHGVAVRWDRAAPCSPRWRPASSPRSRWPRSGRWRSATRVWWRSPAAPSRSTASGRSISGRPPRSRSRSGTTGRACSMCVLPSPLRRRSGCWFANQPCRERS